MEFRTTNPYPVAGMYCDACGQGFTPENMSEGMYHCTLCNEDYHKGCIKIDVDQKERIL